jgi:hypothetical protein
VSKTHPVREVLAAIADRSGGKYGGESRVASVLWIIALDDPDAILPVAAEIVGTAARRQATLVESGETTTQQLTLQ